MFNAFLRRCNEPELLDRLSLFEGFVNRADHVEGLFRQLLAFAVNNHLEATDRFLERNVLTGRARKHFGHVEGLGQEALDLTSTRHGELVFRRQFVHTENCDDVAQFLVLLQRFLNAAGDRVVFFADDVGVDLTGRGSTAG